MTTVDDALSYIVALLKSGYRSNRNGYDAGHNLFGEGYSVTAQGETWLRMPTTKKSQQ